MGSTWSYLDITALGRQEEYEDSPDGYPQTPPYQWWNLQDEYDKAGLSGREATVPRHREIGAALGRKICDQLGVPRYPGR